MIMGYHKKIKIKNLNRGVTLIELTIAIAILGLVLLMAFSMNLFGWRVFSLSESTSINQFDARMPTDFITKQIRFADTVQILNSTSPSPSTGYNDIILESNSIKYYEDGVLQPIIGAQTASDYTLSFTKVSDTILRLKIGKQGTTDFDLETEVVILNLTTPISGTSGYRIRYKTDLAESIVTPTPVNPTITFNPNGGTLSGPSTISQAAGSSLTAPSDPTRTNYNFDGWTPSLPASMPSSNQTYTAQWSLMAGIYSITFNSNGGTPVPSITELAGTVLSTPTNPTKTGYTFNGWNPSMPATMPVGGASLNALWDINQYTITFDSAGGSAVPSITQDYGTVVTAPADPTRTGYTFTGWSSPVPSSMPEGGDHLTAQWIANTYTVSFNSTGGSAPSPTSKLVEYGATYGTLPTVTRSGFTFVGWFTEATGGTQITSGTTVTSLTNHTLYAQWTAGTYTVTFNSNGGSAPSPSSKVVTFGSTYGTLPTVSRSSHAFLGWYTTSTGGSLIQSGTTVTSNSDHTIYARWLAAPTIAWGNPTPQKNNINVTNTQSGATFNLYRNGTFVRSQTGTNFSGITTSGTYTVTQTFNGIQSPSSNSLTK